MDRGSGRRRGGPPRRRDTPWRGDPLDGEDPLPLPGDFDSRSEELVPGAAPVPAASRVGILHRWADWVANAFMNVLLAWGAVPFAQGLV